MNTNYQAVIFDIGNVLFHISMENALIYWSLQTNTDFNIFKQKFEFGEAHKEFERGNISAEAYRLSICETTGIDISPTLFFNGWNMIYLETFPQIQEIITSLKKNYKVVALSNTNITHEDVWKWKYKDLINSLDFVFASHHIGHIKPDKSCYEYVLNKLNIVPEKTIFFDDKLENIEGAKSCGMDAVQVFSPKQMYESMQAKGLVFEVDWSKI